jgi:membrane-associated phospholipid phosphatase
MIAPMTNANPPPPGMADRTRPPVTSDEAGPLAGTPSAPPRPEEIRRAGPLLLAGFAALLGCALVLAVVASAVRRSETYALDTVGNTFVHRFASPALDVVMQTATELGRDPGLVAIVTVAAVVLVRAKRFREAVFIAVVLGGSILLNWGMKLFFHRARPVLPWAVAPPDYSFPSGHAMNSMALALAISLVVWRLAGPRWGAVSFAGGVLAAGVIGLSRVYLGVHYPTDVLGGFATAALWVAIVVAVFRVSTTPRSSAPARGKR